MTSNYEKYIQILNKSYETKSPISSHANAALPVGASTPEEFVFVADGLNPSRAGSALSSNMKNGLRSDTSSKLNSNLNQQSLILNKIMTEQNTVEASNMKGNLLGSFGQNNDLPNISAVTGNPHGKSVNQTNMDAVNLSLSKSLEMEERKFLVVQSQVDALQSTVALLIDKFDNFNLSHDTQWRQAGQKIADIERHMQKVSREQEGRQFNLDR